MHEIAAFQRARKPEEQQLRREAILAAAAELFDAGGEQAAGLNAIAAKAGFTKSNVYRYFESREEVLLSLFVADLEAFVTAYETEARSIPQGDVVALAELTARGFIDRPRLATMISIIASVLEQNVSVPKIVALKRTLTRLYSRVAVAVHDCLPGTSIEDCSWAASIAATLVAGMWPTVNSSPAAAEVLAMPEFAHLKPMPERDLARAVRALFASIV
jgi:TetR/AcrR family transcriptional regulator